MPGNPNRYVNPGGPISRWLVEEFPVGSRVRHLEGRPFHGEVTGHWGSRIVLVRPDKEFNWDGTKVGIDCQYLERIDNRQGGDR